MTAVDVRRFGWRPILICWVLAVVLFYLPLLSHAGGVLPFTDNDDITRMVTATDLANGQAWQDKVEHRDNAPFGSPMHWSRLVDAPIAGLLLVARPLVGAAAPDLVAHFWPPLLLLGLLAMSVGLTRRMMGPGYELLAAVLPILSIVVLAEFSPGRIDHHNWQMILTTGLVWATVSGRTNPLAAIIAGLLAATSLAIGVETLPFLIGAIMAFSLFWVRDAAAAGNARRFALAFAAGTAGHFLLATTPNLYLASACDELSDTYVVAAGLVAAAICLATLTGGRLSPGRRLLLVSLLGALAGALTLVLFPECRGGPYARLDPRAFELLLAHVPEAQPLWTRSINDPATAVSFAIASFVGIGILVWCCAVTKGEGRIDWLVLLLYLTLATIVMVLQIRGARLAVMPAMPAGVWLIARARAAYRERAGVLHGAGVAASWLAFAGILQFILPAAVSEVVANTPTATDGKTIQSSYACFEPSAYASLAALPAGNVIAPTIIGPRIMRYTDDGVVSAGYHRNPAGAIDVDDFLNAGETTARTIATRRGLTYVVACRGLTQFNAGADSEPDSFDALWAQDRHWDWLVPVSAAGDRLQIFRIEPGR